MDRTIVPLLLERLAYIAQAGSLKKDRDTVRDAWRIEDVVNKAKSTATANGGNSKYIEDIYRHLIEWSINHEFVVWDEINDQEDQEPRLQDVQ